MSERIKTFKRDNLTFNVIDTGPIDGTPVVLLHGWPQRATLYDDVTPFLHEAGLRTYCPDQRGYSPGARPRSRFAYRFKALVCAQAGLSDRYFYESFTDREELLGTVWDQMRDETLAMILTAISDAADKGALEQLRLALDATVHHIADEPNRAQIIFGDHAGSAVLEQRRRETVQMATDLMIGMARPFLAEDVDDRALRINVVLGIGGFVELMLAWRDGLVDATPDEIVGHLSDVGTSLSGRFLSQSP